MKTDTTMNADTPPFPRLGEIYRVLALALDTKHKSMDSGGLYRDIDRLAREGEYDWSLLPTLCQELITKPLLHYTDAEFAALVEQFVRHIHEDYIHLVATISLDSMSREEALPLLVEHYFSWHGCELLLAIQKKLGGPNLLALLDAEANPLTVVLDWASEASADQRVKPLVKMAFPGSTDADKTARDKVGRWGKGKQLPEIGSINAFVDKLKDKDFAQHANLRCWLVVARALAWLEEKSPVPLRHIMRRHFLLGLKDVDIGGLLSLAAFHAGQNRQALSIPGHMLKENLKPTTPKLAGDKAKTKADLEALQRLVAKHDPEGRTQFHIEWFHGRWHALSGELKEALPFYEKAARLVNYRGGDAQKQITEEALVIAGYLGEKTFLKQLKHQAIVFGLFSSPPENVVVEEWEIAHFRQQFHGVFLACGRFTEAKPEQIDGPELPFLVLDEEKISSLNADLRHPNRVFKIESADGQFRRWPQLRLFASYGRAHEVAKLLEHGVSVDKLDESNGSALLCAIQHAEQTGEREALDLLLKQTHAKETLNKATNRKRRTPLLCAIDYGEPDVVARLLKMGADASGRGHIDKITPLYHCLGQMALLESPQKLYAHMQKSLMSSPDMMQREVMRRHNVSFTGVFGDASFTEIFKEPWQRNVFSALLQAMMKLHKERHSQEKLLQIIQLLLKHQASPNAPHAYPAPGRTPLMLAAENNSVPALDLMLKHGGDPYIKDAAGNNCMKIAMSFSSHAVVNYLRAKGVR